MQRLEQLVGQQYTVNIFDKERKLLGKGTDTAYGAAYWAALRNAAIPAETFYPEKYVIEIQEASGQQASKKYVHD